MGWDIGGESNAQVHPECLVVDLCNQLHGERQGSNLVVLVVNAQHGARQKLRTVKEGLAVRQVYMTVQYDLQGIVRDRHTLSWNLDEDNWVQEAGFGTGF